MKTCLFSPCYLDGGDPGGVDRLDRMKRYLDYYSLLKEELGFDTLFLSDDGSSESRITELMRGRLGVEIILNPKLQKQGGLKECDYPWCWRALYDVRIPITLGYDKIITIDSDCFVLSNRLAKYVKELKSGWRAFHIPKYNFASAEFHILCRDQFPMFEAYCQTPFMDRNGTKMEEVMPFTHLHCGFDIDRYGETRTPLRPGMDFYSNSYGGVPMRFESWPARRKGI